LSETEKKEKKWRQISNKKFSVGQFWQGRSGKGNKLIFNFGLKVSILFVVVSLLLFLKAVCSE
jgi:hypothetical protein